MRTKNSLKRAIEKDFNGKSRRIKKMIFKYITGSRYGGAIMEEPEDALYVGLKEN